MSAAAMLTQARADDVTLVLAPPDGLRLRGDPVVLAKWTPLLRPHKAELLAMLTEPWRMWDITLADGSGHVSTFAPPQTWAEVLSCYRGASTTPVPDPDKCEPLPEDVEQLVVAWLDRIGEDDPTARREALALARSRPGVQQIYRVMASRPAPPVPSPGATGTLAADPQEPDR